MTRYAVVLTHNRHDMLWPCVEAISPQVDRVVIVDNASTPPVSPDDWPLNVEVFREELQPPNIAYMWNTQIDRFASRGPGQEFEVAFLCDDVIVPDDWYVRVTGALRQHGAAAGSAHSYAPIGSPVLKREHDTDIYGRMCGWAFVVAGESGIRANETMHWWWVDTDIDWQARHAGGMVLAPGPIAVNQQPDHWTGAKPELQERARLDRGAFHARWGSTPW